MHTKADHPLELHTVFFMIQPTIQAKVSLDRISDFLRKTELLDHYASQLKDEPTPTTITDAARFDKSVIGFQDASFTWSDDDATSDGTLTPSRRKFCLRIYDELVFKKGAINLIIGPTGCGKTSLLMALLGEMHFKPMTPGSWFNLPRAGGVAYAAQESWVQNETIRVCPVSALSPFFKFTPFVGQYFIRCALRRGPLQQGFVL